MADCIEWQGTLSGGYGVFSNRETRRNVYAHRHAYEQEFGPIPEGAFVRHKCDNPPCVNPEHLELGSHADNMRDMVDRGRSRKGERHHAARLTADDVRDIRLRAQTEPVRALAREYEVHPQHVYLILQRRRWSHV